MNEKSTNDAPLLLESLDRLEGIEAGLKALAHPQGAWTVGRVAGSSGALLTVALWRRSKRNLLVVVKDQNEMYRWLDDLQYFAGQYDLADPERILPLPHPETLPYEMREPDPAVQSERLGTLATLLLPRSAEPLLVVAPVRTLLRRFPSLAFWRGQVWPLRVGGEVDRDAFVRRLSEEGYEFRELVCGPGEYSVRGGIIDVYPFQAPHALRIELFGNEIDSLRIFDLVTQRSTAQIEQFTLLPSDENRLVHHALDKELSLEGLLDGLEKDFRLVVAEPAEMEVEAARFSELVEKMYREVDVLRKDAGEETPEWPLIPPEKRYLLWEDLQQSFYRRGFLALSPFAHASEDGPGANLDSTTTHLASGAHKKNLAKLVEMAAAGQQIWIACDNEGQKHRLHELLGGDSVPPQARERFHIHMGALHWGFSLPQLKWTWTTDRQIFGRYKRIRQRMAKGIALPIVDLVNLKPGDFVVHEEQGIGRYRGLKLLEIEDRKAEFLELEYADGGVLYVPIEQIERVGRYIGSSAAPPKLSKLGGKAWQTTKAKARQAIEDMAAELLDLYAERTVHTGHTCKNDTPWQYEFEASFLFEETPDQLRSIREVKKDMESPKPMDRLICGDVGFGKTEVAMRAAFKAVMEGRQAAVLVPTTVLADQHYRTFSERMADYPVTVEMLSRFRTPAEQKEAVQKLAEGKIDIIIGTHRLLQKDIQFRDLGLVVIDEEQRFGVRHKERLKQMRTLVDCMALTATPIPRTLYMAMNGVRDMSIVNTPPKDRLPIQTYVYEWSHEVIESAILREMARGGQVYFVHNRIQSIAGIARLIQEQVPEARIAVGHGQMEEKQLARIMHEFVDHKYDVLLSTTIIESGLDIPNVNTIIINRADAFGLADLYQLRGRVGRDRHRAYCYLLVPSKGALSRVAKQRLLAIQEFNQLGSGFQLALRDMEIRGMGNLLGRQQHGHIAAIGFDLYCRLLSDTVEQLTGKKRDTYPEPQLDLVPSVSGEISPQHVPSARLRMSLYKRLAALRSREEVDQYEREMRDLYGAPPPEAQRLMDAQRLWILAWQAGIDRVQVGARKARLRYCEQAAHRHFTPERVIELDRLVAGQLTVSIKQGVVLTLRARQRENGQGQDRQAGEDQDAGALLGQVKVLLERIARHAAEPPAQ